MVATQYGFTPKYRSSFSSVLFFPLPDTCSPSYIFLQHFEGILTKASGVGGKIAKAM